MRACFLRPAYKLDTLGWVAGLLTVQPLADDVRDDTCRNSERKSQDTHGHTHLSGYQFGAATMIIIRYVTYICKNMEPSSDDFVWGFFAGAESVLYGKFWILM